MGFTHRAALRLWWGLVPFVAPTLAAQELGDTARAAQEMVGPDLMSRDTTADLDSVAPILADTTQRPVGEPDTAARDTATTSRDTGETGYSVPRDTLPGDTLPRDTIAVDSILRDNPPRDTILADSLAVGRIQTESVPDDTSLTARMDVRRGGGLKRSEFPDLRETAALTGYRVFLRLLDQSGVGRRMRPELPYTLLAPGDSAFARIPPGALERLEADSAALAAWVKSLVLEGSLTGNELLERVEATSLGGQKIEFSQDPSGALLAGGAVVVQPDLLARDGVLHGLDRVVLPEAATSASP